MAPGRKGLSAVQYGFESTPGTAAAQYAKWRGPATALDDQAVIEEIEEMIGVLDGADRSELVQYLGGIELGETPATFEQLAVLLALAFGGPTTGTQDGTGDDYIYETDIPTTSLPTAKPVTIEAGDNFEVETMKYCVATKVSISGKVGETVKMSATLMGRKVDRLGTAFTAGAVLPLVKQIPTGLGTVYLDSIGGVYGTTQVSSGITAFKIDFETMWVPSFEMNGTLEYAAPLFIGKKITGELTYKHDTAVSRTGGAKQFFVDQTPKLLEIKLVENGVFTNPGTSYQKRTAIIDLPLKYNKPGIRGDENGVSTVNMGFFSKYNETAGNAGKFIIVNDLATLPGAA